MRRVLAKFGTRNCKHRQIAMVNRFWRPSLPPSASPNGLRKAKRANVPVVTARVVNAVARHVRVQGYTIDQFTNLSASRAARMIEKLKLRGTHQTIAAGLIPEIQQRLRFMEKVGLGYLALGRSAKNGEWRRVRSESAWRHSSVRICGVSFTCWMNRRSVCIRATTCACSKRLPRCATKVIRSSLSSTMTETMRHADHIIDLGPRARISTAANRNQRNLG